MLLGDLIARLEDETFAAETLLSIGDLSLTAEVIDAAAREGVTTGEYVVACVGHFANQASDQEWVTLVGQMGKSDAPGQVFLRRAARRPEGRGVKRRLTYPAARSP
jgi:hypothetical protein